MGPQRTERRGSAQLSAKNPSFLNRTNTPRAKIWTEEEDEFLWRTKAAGWNWDKIAAELGASYPPPESRYRKTANACRKRHERIKVKQCKAQLGPGRERWEEVVLSYKSNRESMWQPIADQLGYKRWQDIEQAVC